MESTGLSYRGLEMNEIVCPSIFVHCYSSYEDVWKHMFSVKIIMKIS